MMDFLSTPEQLENPLLAEDSQQLQLLYDSEPYTAYTEDLEFMWRWTIYREDKLVQEGCSLTKEASRRAIEHVLAFFHMASQPVPVSKGN